MKSSAADTIVGQRAEAVIEIQESVGVGSAVVVSGDVVMKKRRKSGRGGIHHFHS